MPATFGMREDQEPLGGESVHHGIGDLLGFERAVDEEAASLGRGAAGMSVRTPCGHSADTLIPRSP